WPKQVDLSSPLKPQVRLPCLEMSYVTFGDVPTFGSPKIQGCPPLCSRHSL
ncbi:hypothetical protein L9F63_020541, partial [Diploptera punctata]